MNQTDSAHITAGQYFRLLFVGHTALLLLYTPVLCQGTLIHEWLLPLLLVIPLEGLLAIPLLLCCRNSRTSSPLEELAQRHPVSGRVWALLYSVYCVLTCMNVLGNLLCFMRRNLPQGVSDRLLVSILIAGGLYACLKGMEPVARMGLIVLFLTVLGAVLMLCFLQSHYSVDRAAAVFSEPVYPGLGKLLFLLSQMDSLTTLLVLRSSVKGKIHRGAGLYILYNGLFLIGMLLLIVGSAGHYLSLQEYPVFHSIDAGGFLQRLDPFFILLLTSGIFCRLTLFLIAFLRSAKIVLPHLSAKKTGVVLSALLMAAVWWMPQPWIESLVSFRLLWSVGALLFLTAVPFLLLLEHRLSVRKKGRRGRRRWMAAGGAGLMLVLLLSGCSGLQLNQRVIVQAVGIDRLQSGCRLTFVTLQTDHPQQLDSVCLLTAEGSNTEEALCHLEEQTGKKLLLNQCVLILMNHAAADESTSSLCKLMQSAEIPKSIPLLVSRESAAITLHQAIEDYHYHTEELAALSDGRGPACTLFDYVRQLAEGQNVFDYPELVLLPSEKALTVSGAYRSSTSRKGA